MSNPTDETNELDSYGVWVKNDKPEDLSDLQNESLDDLGDIGDIDLSDFDTEIESLDSDSVLADNAVEQISDAGIDIPDFELDDEVKTEGDFAEDFSDMFKDSPVEPESNDILNDDTALTIDELDNITNNAEVSSDTEITDTLDTEKEVDISSFEEVTFDDFSSGSVAEPVEEAAAEEEGEIELSLDDFMDGGFSDESVASGNNGFEPGKNPAEMASNSDSEEISLDDFLDADDFGLGEAPKKEEETFIDEKPLDMSISFDSSAETVQTEDNNAASYVSDYDDEDDFDTTVEASIEETSTSASSSDIDAEEISLADFGIDEDADETPVTQDVAEQKNKEAVVDFDLTVGNENMATAPVVNEIKDKHEENIEELSDEIIEKADEPAAGTQNVSSDLLQQIVADLASLKNEITSLKANLAEMKSVQQAENIPVESEPVIEAVEEEILTEAADDESSIPEIEIPEETESSGGFFSNSGDEDDTIALSGFELDNIMNTAVFEAETTEEAAASLMEDTEAKEDAVEAADDLPETIDFEPVETSTEELTASDESAAQEINNIDAVSDGTLSYDFSDEAIEEPDLENIFDEETFEDEDLPEEISISTEDDMLVESSKNDFMESISDTTEQNIEPIDNDSIENILEEVNSEKSELPAEEESLEEIVLDDSTEEESLEEKTLDDSVEEISEEITEEPVELSEEESEITFDEAQEEPALEEIKTEESVSFDDIFEETEATDEAASDESSIEESFDSMFETEDTLEAISEDTETDTSDSEAIAEDDLDSFFETIDDSAADETVVEEVEPELDIKEEEFNTFDTISDDEVPVVEPVLDEEVIPETAVSEDELTEEFVSVEEDDSISDSNLDYLTTELDQPVEETESEINKELKQDIKSVLLYMDQLLANLPEDKIDEFAKSEEFNTYKKLFSELGLS